MTSRQYSSSSASASSLRQSETACVSAIKAAAKASENGGITSSNQLYCCSHSRGVDRPICTAPDLPARLGERRKLICIKFGCPRASYIHPAVACSVLREFRCVQSRGCVNGGKRNPSVGGGPRGQSKTTLNVSYGHATVNNDHEGCLSCKLYRFRHRLYCFYLKSDLRYISSICDVKNPFS